MLGFVTQPGSGLPPTHHPRNARSNSLVGLSIDAMNGRSECISQKDLKNAPPPAFTLISPIIGANTVNTPRARGGRQGGGNRGGCGPSPGGPRGGISGGGPKTPIFDPPRGGRGGHFPLPKIRPQPEMRTGKKPTKLYSTKGRPKTAFLTPPGGGGDPGGGHSGAPPPTRPDPRGGPPIRSSGYPPGGGGPDPLLRRGVRDPSPSRVGPRSGPGVAHPLGGAGRGHPTRPPPGRPVVEGPSDAEQRCVRGVYGRCAHCWTVRVNTSEQRRIP